MLQHNNKLHSINIYMIIITTITQQQQKRLQLTYKQVKQNKSGN